MRGAGGLTARCADADPAMPASSIVGVIGGSRLPMSGLHDVLERRLSSVGIHEIIREHLVLCVADLRGST